MALVTDLIILNPADKTRHYTVAMGNGVPAETNDPLVSDIKKYPQGSQYTDLAGNFFVRIAVTKAATDWKKINA